MLLFSKLIFKSCSIFSTDNIPAACPNENMSTVKLKCLDAPPTEACLWFSVFGHVRIGGKEMWTWRSLGPACSLQAQDQPSHIEKKKKIRNA